MLLPLSVLLRTLHGADHILHGADRVLFANSVAVLQRGRLCWAGWCIGWGGSMVVLCGSMRFYGGSMVVLCGVRWGGSVRCEVEVGVRCIGWGGSVRLMTAGWVHCC